MLSRVRPLAKGIDFPSSWGVMLIPKGMISEKICRSETIRSQDQASGSATDASSAPERDQSAKENTAIRARQVWDPLA